MLFQPKIQTLAGQPAPESHRPPTKHPLKSPSSSGPLSWGRPDQMEGGRPPPRRSGVPHTPGRHKPLAGPGASELLLTGARLHLPQLVVPSTSSRARERESDTPNPRRLGVWSRGRPGLQDHAQGAAVSMLAPVPPQTGLSEAAGGAGKGGEGWLLPGGRRRAGCRRGGEARG